MKYLAISIVVFFAFFHAAHSLQCYMCTPGAASYSVEQCEKDQQKVNCSLPASVSPGSCLKASLEFEEGKKTEQRSCVPKTTCELVKAACENADLRKEQKVKECSVSCCTSDLCNNSLSVSINVMLIVAAALCSFKFF